MTIELITGTPGAGKTCYAVAKRIIPEFGRQVAVEREGGAVDLVERRIIVAGIRGLVCQHDRLPHTLTGERISAADADRWNECDKDGEPIWKRLPGDVPMQVEASLFNWWLWCRPGDLIVVDEVQFIIPRGTLGKTPPHYIKSLEIHRHYGVDFLFITQSPQLLDATIRNLVGLHRHVRSVFGTSLCLLYEWDHASSTERIKGASKSSYIRKKAYFKLYKSTVAVVSPPKSGRTAVYAIPVLLGAMVFLGARASNRFTAPAAAVAAPATAAAVPSLTAALTSSSPASGSVVDGKPPIVVRYPELAGLPKLTGCYTVPDGTCFCVDDIGYRVKPDAWVCEMSAKGFDGLVRPEKRRQPAENTPAYGAAAGTQPAASAGLRAAL